MVSLEDSKMIDNRTELEVLLLMEFCTCSLLEAMTRGSMRDEREIYNVFSQVCTAVARLHANNPPISHRDLKVENILLGEDGRWKLCDFGSATTATYLPTTERERSVAEDDINRNTTMLYRAPEMVDLYRRQPINEKVDVWALGCVLYKMAYGVDPFDGGLGIMNARYTFPEFRKTTPEFEGFIGYLLNPDPTLRPNIQQVQERLAALRGVPAPKQVSSPPNAPSITLSNGNNQQQVHNARPATAPPKAAAAAADLVDWGDDAGSTKSPPPPQQQQHAQLPANLLHNSAPLPHQHQHQQVKPPATQQRSATPSQQPVKNPLWDSLEWQAAPAGSQPNTPPKTSSPAQSQRNPPTTPSKPASQVPDLLDFGAPKQPTQQQQPSSKSSSGDLDFLEFSNPVSKPPQPAHHHAHQNSPSRPSPLTTAQPPASKPVSKPPASQQPASKSELPDLLDFSDPPPKATNTPTLVMHPGYHSPQPFHQTYYSPPPTTHYSPQIPHNRTVPGPDPLAQFAKPMQKSLPDVDDFDPLAPKKPTPTPTPSSSQQPPNPSKLSVPPPSSSRAKQDTSPSLIDF